MTIDPALVKALRTLALEGSDTRPAAVGTLVAAATDILLEDIGPQGAIDTLEMLTNSTRLAFGAEETIQ